MHDAAQEDIDAAGENTATAHRLHEMQDFYAYVTREMPALINSWRKQFRQCSQPPPPTACRGYSPLPCDRFGPSPAYTSTIRSSPSCSRVARG